MTARILLSALALAACGDDATLSPDAAIDDAVVGSDTSSTDAPSVVGVLTINEVMPSNTTSCTDPVGGYDDWVELYNAGDTDLELGGYTVTDDLVAPTKVTLLAGLIVPAHGYRMIWCDEEIQGRDHVDLKLDASGEAFAIYMPDGTLVDSFTWGDTPTDVAYARLPDGTGAFTTCNLASCAGANGASCPVAAITQQER